MKVPKFEDIFNVMLDKESFQITLKHFEDVIKSHRDSNIIESLDNVEKKMKIEDREEIKNIFNFTKSLKSIDDLQVLGLFAFSFLMKAHRERMLLTIDEDSQYKILLGKIRDGMNEAADKINEIESDCEKCESKKECEDLTNEFLKNKSGFPEA